MNTSDKSRIVSSIEIAGNPNEIWDTLVAFSNYRRWNPVVAHAVIYGPVTPGTEIKIQSGKWDLKYTIIAASPPAKLELDGGGIGLRMKLRIGICSEEGLQTVKIEAVYRGWFSKLFRNSVKQSMEGSIDLFLASLHRRMTRGNDYELARDEEKTGDEEHNRILSNPTPFRLLYRSRKQKPRKGRSLLK